MDVDSGPTNRRRATPLGVFGAVLAVLVAIEVAAWLWGHTLGSDFLWFSGTLVTGFVLVVVWLLYLVAWAAFRKRFAWHLLVIPALGLLGLAIAFSGLPQKARWSYDEPRFTTAAQEALADPRSEFSDQRDRRIGTQTVSGTAKAGGVVTFSVAGAGFFSVATLQYRPDGGSPTFDRGARGERLSDGWWVVHTQW